MIQADLKGPLLPFKGKGGARRRQRELEVRRDAVRENMQQIVQEFKATFRPPRPAHLVVHHQGGYFNLRWRAPGRGGRGQTFFELCTSEPGRRMLRELPPAVRQSFLNFERRRIDLNLASSLCQHELRRLREYQVKLDGLRAFVPQNRG